MFWNSTVTKTFHFLHVRRNYWCNWSDGIHNSCRYLPHVTWKNVYSKKTIWLLKIFFLHSDNEDGLKSKSKSSTLWNRSFTNNLLPKYIWDRRTLSNIHELCKYYKGTRDITKNNVRRHWWHVVTMCTIIKKQLFCINLSVNERSNMYYNCIRNFITYYLWNIWSLYMFIQNHTAKESLGILNYRSLPYTSMSVHHNCFYTLYT